MNARLGSFLAGVVVEIVGAAPFLGRYRMVGIATHEQPYAYRLDCWTGEMRFAYRGRWFGVAEPEPKNQDKTSASRPEKQASWQDILNVPEKEAASNTK